MSRGKSSSVKEDLAAKYRIVAGDGHKKQHGKREHKVGARGQQSQTRELRCFRWNGRAIGSVFFCPPDKFLLDAPDDAQTFNIMNQPSPPPTPMASSRLL